jgi:hypothetical protein
MQTIILLGLVSLLTDISSEMVYPLLYLTTTLGATPAIIGGLLWGMIGPSATFHFGCMMGILAATGMFVVVPKLSLMTIMLFFKSAHGQNNAHP